MTIKYIHNAAAMSINPVTTPQLTERLSNIPVEKAIAGIARLFTLSVRSRSSMTVQPGYGAFQARSSLQHPLRPIYA